MNSPSAAEKKCSQKSEIAAYIDGELLPRDELELERHLTVCGDCRRELNEQKKLLCVLDFALDAEKQIELPANFTRMIVVNAESNVSGLRRPQERSKALLVCATLFLLVILGLGRENEAVLDAFAKFTEQCLVVVKFVFHLFYDIALGAAIILRSINSYLISDSTAFLALTIIFSSFFLIALLPFIFRSPKLEIQAREK